MVDSDRICHIQNTDLKLESYFSLIDSKNKISLLCVYTTQVYSVLVEEDSF